MENYRMNYNACRSCRVMPREAVRKTPPFSNDCGCSDKVENTGVYTHADHLPLTMAYVPFQQFHTTFELHKALQVGTVFPELCKPFCGKRGVRR